MTMTDPGADLIPVNTGAAPLSPAAAREAMETYQQISRALITPDDMQRIGRTEFPKRSALRKLANAYRVSTEIIKDQVDYDDDGNMVRARITVRATHPDGRISDGDGICHVGERTGGRKPDPKIEHDTHGTAVTRAKNRAISDLIAFGAVSAEEAEADTGGPAARSPSWAAHVANDTVSATAEQLTRLFTVLGVLDPAAAVGRVGQGIFDYCDGGLPVCVAHTIGLILDAYNQAPAGDGTGEPVDTTSDEKKEEA